MSDAITIKVRAKRATEVEFVVTCECHSGRELTFVLGHEVQGDERVRRVRDLGRQVHDEPCPKCEGHPPTAAHPCPYRNDVDNDGVTLCTCCASCTEACSMEV